MAMPHCLTLALLCATSALLHTPRSVAQELPALIPQRASVLNVTFDPGTWTLHWSCRDNVVVTLCTAKDIKRDGRPRLQRIRPKDCHCQFQPLTLHLGVTLEVNATVNHSAVQETLSYVNRGAQGSAAQNVTCVIHDAGVMTCLWVAGPSAPHDVQYFLHIRNTSGYVLMECPAYLGGHLHTGCRLDDLSLVPQHAYVTVTGSSRMGDVMFYDVSLNTKRIERLSPPGDVTVVCNSSHCAVMWSQPRTWAPMTFSDFRYEVDIQRQNPEPGTSNPKVYISSQEENRFEFPSPEPRLGHVVSVRAGDVRSERWSVWSPFVQFGSERRVVPRLHVYLIVVTVTLLCAMGLGLACKRFIRMQSLFPQVPEIKDKVSDDDRINPETLRKDLLLQMDKTG